MQQLKSLKEAALKDMLDILTHLWTRSHFKIYSKCDLQVNNMCEAFNKAILECRDKPIVTLLEGIKHYLTTRIISQKELMNIYTDDICPRTQLLLENNKKYAESWTPTWHDDDDFSIFGVTNDIDTYFVDLKQQICACRKWDLTGIPCSHPISCIWQNKTNLKIMSLNITGSLFQ
ncbi:unnamed protein product [Lathyrus sativus]|nr:unnamed protein product [Lathyrus sativus]